MKRSVTTSLFILCMMSACAQLADISSDSSFSKPYKLLTDKQKIVKATKGVLIGEGIVLGILIVLPQEWTGWHRPFYENGFQHLKTAFTKLPRWDPDPVYVNFVLHPLGGAMYYNSLRLQGFSEWNSFLYSAAASIFFEYIVESVAEQPSSQDLIYTPIGGYFIGEIGYRLTLKMKRNGFTFLEKLAVCLLNPTYVMMHGLRKK